MAYDGPPLPLRDVGDTSFKRAGLWAIDSANPNCWASARKDLASTSADIVLLQEVKARAGDEAARAEDQAAKLHWSMSVEPCATMDSGYPSAGVAIAVRSHLGLARPPVPHRCTVLEN